MYAREIFVYQDFLQNTANKIQKKIFKQITFRKEYATTLTTLTVTELGGNKNQHNMIMNNNVKEGVLNEAIIDNKLEICNETYRSPTAPQVVMTSTHVSLLLGTPFLRGVA